jgi:hypothetical protein
MSADRENELALPIPSPKANSGHMPRPACLHKIHIREQQRVDAKKLAAANFSSRLEGACRADSPESKGHKNQGSSSALP